MILGELTTKKSEEIFCYPSEILKEHPCRLNRPDRVLVERILNRLERHGTVDGFTEDEIIYVLNLVYEHLKPLPTLVNVDVPVIIFGDLHGIH